MPTLHMLVGLPASGKSTWAKEQSLPIVSSDDIRNELFGGEYNSADNAKVFATARERVCEYLKDGKDVIYDATNISYQSRKPMIKAARSIRGKVSIIAHVFVVPIPILLRRRTKRAPITAMLNALYHFQPPCEWERIDDIYCHYITGIRQVDFDYLSSRNPNRDRNERAAELCLKQTLAPACRFLDVCENYDGDKVHASCGAYECLVHGCSPYTAALVAYHELPNNMTEYDKMRKVMSVDFAYDLDLVYEADVRSRIN